MKITAPFRALVIAHLFYCVAPAGGSLTDDEQKHQKVYFYIRVKPKKKKKTIEICTPR